MRCVSPSLAFSAVVPSKNSDSDEVLAWLQDFAASKEFNNDAGINAVVAAIQGLPPPLRPTGRVLYYEQPDELLQLLPGVPLVTLVGIRLHWRAAIDCKPVSSPCLSRCGCCTPHSPNARLLSSSCSIHAEPIARGRAKPQQPSISPWSLTEQPRHPAHPVRCAQLCGGLQHTTIEPTSNLLNLPALACL